MKKTPHIYPTNGLSQRSAVYVWIFYRKHARGAYGRIQGKDVSIL